MFGFGKKKEKFNTLQFVGVDHGYITLRLVNSNKEIKRLYLEISMISKYLPKQNQSSIWHVLGMMPTNDRQKVLTAYKKMAMIYHPDHGGTSDSFRTLIDAKDKALVLCK